MEAHGASSATGFSDRQKIERPPCGAFLLSRRVRLGLSNPEARLQDLEFESGAPRFQAMNLVLRDALASKAGYRRNGGEHDYERTLKGEHHS